jgi:hypothetical protein
MMERLFTKYRKRGVLLDTNLLVIYLVGRMGREHLKDCRATKSVTPTDFDLLCDFLAPFDVLISTPHILTESSNLGGRLPQNLHAGFRLILQSFAADCQELYKPSRELTASRDFLRFGLADAAIADVAPGMYLVVTDEFALHSLLLSRGVDVINFNHLRELEWEYRTRR